MVLPDRVQTESLIDPGGERQAAALVSNTQRTLELTCKGSFFSPHDARRRNSLENCVPLVDGPAVKVDRVECICVRVVRHVL